MELKLPQITEIKGIRVLTTQQVSDMYGTNRQTISYNFNYNKPKFKEGKHYIVLSGQALRDFKGCHENLDNLKYAHIAYLWTEKGALLHAKSVNTDKAWQAYEYLVDYYFRAKEQEQQKPKTYREIREAALAEQRQQVSASQIEDKAKEPVDIAPMFRSLISELPVEALDEMEKTLRGYTYKATQLATISILTEKIKREMQH